MVVSEHRAFPRSGAFPRREQAQTRQQRIFEGRQSARGQKKSERYQAQKAPRTERLDLGITAGCWGRTRALQEKGRSPELGETRRDGLKRRHKLPRGRMRNCIMPRVMPEMAKTVVMEMGPYAGSILRQWNACAGTPDRCHGVPRSCARTLEAYREGHVRYYHQAPRPHFPWS